MLQDQILLEVVIGVKISVRMVVYSLIRACMIFHEEDLRFLEIEHAVYQLCPAKMAYVMNFSL